MKKTRNKVLGLELGLELGLGISTYMWGIRVKSSAGRA